VALFGASYALIIAWLGPEFHTSGTVALVLGLGYAINIATGAGTAVAMGAGRPDLDRNYSLLGLALNLLLTIGLGVLFGRWGVIAATALGLAISSVWLIRSVDRWLAASVLSLRGIAGSPGTRGLLAWGAIVGGSSALIASSVGLTSRWAALALGVATLLVFGTVWLIAVTRMGILSIRGLWPFGSDLLSWRRAA
jgi:O-antigen/teichoic acid export membrane protein